jgi:hypothetical protein
MRPEASSVDRLIVSDAYLGLAESAVEFLAEGGKGASFISASFIGIAISSAACLRPSTKVRECCGDAQRDPHQRGHRRRLAKKARRLSLLDDIFQGLSSYLSNLVAEQTDCDCDGAEHTDEEAAYKSQHERHYVCSLSSLETKVTTASVDRDAVPSRSFSEPILRGRQVRAD